MNFEEIIQSIDNPTVKLYRKLSSSKKERMKEGLFVLEGSRLVFDALKEKAAIKYLYFTEAAYKRHIEELNALNYNNKLLRISDSLGRKIALTENTQGIFAVCEMPKYTDLNDFLENGKRYIVLYNLQDPGNAGMIIRTADALGLDGIIFSESCDIYNPKVIRSAMGSIFRLPVFNKAEIEEVFTIAELCGIHTYAAVTDCDASDIGCISFDNKSAVLIGNEGNGLPQRIANKCNSKITIKMNGNIDSLNAAMATGIIMWELKKFG